MRGRPPAFTDIQDLAVAALVRTYRVSGACDILSQSALAHLRPAEFPEPITVSKPTAAAAARRCGVELKPGRPRKTA